MGKKLLFTIVRFRDDERGVFAVIFAVMSLVVVALAGSAVDFTFLQQRRTMMQVALDAAALALHDRIDELAREDIRVLAEQTLRERMGDGAFTVIVSQISIDEDAGSLRLIGQLTMQTMFVGLVGVPELGATAVSEATRKNMRLEVAMVLDNSGSMAEQSRMGQLQVAARQAVRIFFEDANPSRPDVFVGVVPFTQFVNVGPENANADWIDRSGLSSIADDNLMIDAGSPISTFDRIALFEQFRNEEWRGCVEARPYPMDTDDTEPRQSDPDTLFVPLFVPDEPDSRGWYSSYNNSYLDDDRASCEAAPRGYRWSDRTLQERMCKYQNGTVSGASMTHARGPNADCPNNPLTPLSPSERTVRHAVNGMSPQGGTNIAQGATWGLHMLTPSSPLEEAAPMDGAESVTKAMILMTDGDNFHQSSTNMNGSHFYTAYGYPYNGRLGEPGDSTAELQRRMDDRLLETCENAKDLGIIIYTVGLVTSRPETADMLRNCSSGDGYWFLPERPGELDNIFREIADSLSSLRLSR